MMFLWLIYHSAAEHMPTDFKHGLGKPANLAETPFPEDRTQDDQVARHVNAFMQKLHLYNSDVDVHMIGPGTFKGERRYLQHGSMSELFFEYVAHCNANGKDAASLTIFSRVANTVLGKHSRTGHLHFRKPNEHAKCDTCVRLKKALKAKKKTNLIGADDSAVRAYSAHILSQWLDRQIYWSFRSLSQTWFRQQIDLGERKPVLHMKVVYYFWDFELVPSLVKL